MAFAIQPLINGKAYEWADVKVLISGLFVIGITSVNYEQRQAKMNHWGASNYPVTYGNGQKEATCSLTLYFSELQNIRSSIPNFQIVDIPLFDIIVSYLDPLIGIVTHKIRNCRFTNDPVSTNQGDTAISCTLDILPSHIEYV